MNMDKGMLEVESFLEVFCWEIVLFLKLHCRSRRRGAGDRVRIPGAAARAVAS